MVSKAADEPSTGISATADPNSPALEVEMESQTEVQEAEAASQVDAEVGQTLDPQEPLQDLVLSSAPPAKLGALEVDSLPLPSLSQ